MNSNLNLFNGQCNAHIAPQLVQFNLHPGQSFPIPRPPSMPSHRFTCSAQPLGPLKYTLVGTNVSKESQQRPSIIQREQGTSFPRNSVVPDGQSVELMTSTAKQVREIPIEYVPADHKRLVRSEYAPSMFQQGLVSSSKVPTITPPQNCSSENDKNIVRSPKICSPVSRYVSRPVIAIESPCPPRLIPMQATTSSVKRTVFVPSEQVHRLTQGNAVRQPFKFYNVAQSPSDSYPSRAIQTVSEQLERKRKSLSSTPSVSSTHSSIVKVPRTKSIAPATTPNLSSPSLRKQNSSQGEIVCLSSDEDSEEEALNNTVDRITVQNIESIGLSLDAGSSSEVDNFLANGETSASKSRENAKLNVDSSTEPVENIESSNNLSLLNETDCPYLVRNKIDPNCYTPGEVELKLNSVYVNKNMAMPVGVELSTTISASRIVFPASTLSCGPLPSNQNRLPKQLKYDCIRTIRFANMSNFAAVLLSFSTSSCDPQTGLTSGAKPLETVLLVLKTPIPEESLKMLMIIFEIKKVDRSDRNFFKEDSNCVINHYQKIDPNSFDLQSLASPATSSTSSKQKSNNLLISEKTNNRFANVSSNPLYTYKMGKSAISITNEDIKCLQPDEFLNDTIIDFFCNYLLDKHLSPELREKVHLFSSFFIKTYTQVRGASKTANNSTSSSPNDAASKTVQNHQIKYRRHEKVKNWTKNVDLFQKEFIFIPVNEDWHWFLVVICYPNRAVNVNSLQTLMLYGKTQFSGNSSIDTEKFLEEKQPLILVLNSLITSSKSQLFKLLKDYLEIEFESKHTVKNGLNKQIFLHSAPDVPQQTNSYDCGLYLLKYLEKFVTDFINVEQHKQINWEQWFETSETTDMRERFKKIILRLHMESTNQC